MPSIPVILASAALSLAVQAQVAASPPSGSVRMPGIVETPGSKRMPGPIEIEVRSTGRTSDSTFRGDLRQAYKDIDRRRKNGELSRRQARALKRQAGRIGNLADRYGSDGFSSSERRELDMHAHTLRTQVAVQAARPST